jgi:hypothetical protein
LGFDRHPVDDIEKFGEGRGRPVCMLYYAIWFYVILLAPISRFWDTIRRIGFSG